LEPAKTPGAERVAALSDGVVAIVMTLLVLDIRLPRAAEGMSNAELLGAIGEAIPNIAAYALSFVVIAQFWRIHHRRFARLTRVDGGVFWLNTLFLLFIGLLPFVTAILADNGDAVATAAYAVVVAAVSFALSGVFLYARARGFLPEESHDPLWTTLFRSLSVGVVFLASIPMAFYWDADNAKYFWLILVPLGFVERRFQAK
jgi:uncharacterized membrane protein